jgi:hypothetical protein
MATLTRTAATPEAQGFTEAVLEVLEDYEATTGTRSAAVLKRLRRAS